MRSDSKAENQKLIEVISVLQQLLREHQKWLLLIGTGPSMAVNQNMGMVALREHLLNDRNLKACAGWDVIAERLHNNSDLEQALTGVTLNPELLTAIPRSTGDFVAGQDADYRNAILTGRIDWPCSSLLRILVQRLPRNSPWLPIVTSNYDLFIEYACSRMGIRYTTGYVGGILKRPDWNAARDAFFRIESVSEKGKCRNIRVPVPSVEIMKVHGSINLFKSLYGSIIESDVWCSTLPEKYQRLLAPPGDPKNHAVTEYHETWFTEAVRAIRAASAFFAVGYGFNDPHIHKIIVEKAQAGAPIIVLTRGASARLDSLSEIAENIWILTAVKDSDGKTIEDVTRVKNRSLPCEIEIRNERLWSSDIFANKVMGE